MSVLRGNLYLEICYICDDDENCLDDFLCWIYGVYEWCKEVVRFLELFLVGECFDNVLGIIYIIFWDECEFFVVFLCDVGVGVCFFYVKFMIVVKEEILVCWINNEFGYDVIVVIIVFGMGIDKNNVCFVVYWCIFKLFEGYY